MAVTAHEAVTLRRTRMQKFVQNKKLWRGVAAVFVALILWEIGSRWSEWFGYTLPFIGLIPAPSASARGVGKGDPAGGLLGEAGT